MKVWSAPALGILMLYILSTTPLETESLVVKKGLKILSPIALLGGAAGAGGLAGALYTRHKHPPVHHHQQVKHVHHHPIHHMKEMHGGWKHGWDDHGSHGGWHNDEWW